MAEIDADIAAGEAFLVAVPNLTDEDGNQIEVRVKETTEGQVIALMNLLGRLGSKARGNGDGQMKAASRILDIIYSLIPDEDERDEIEYALAVGKIDIDDLMAFFEQSAEEMSGRPTKPSTGSSGRRQSTGRSSQAKSRGRVPASRRSPSASSAT